MTLKISKRKEAQTQTQIKIRNQFKIQNRIRTAITTGVATGDSALTTAVDMEGDSTTVEMVQATMEVETATATIPTDGQTGGADKEMSITETSPLLRTTTTSTAATATADKTSVKAMEISTGATRATEDTTTATDIGGRDPTAIHTTESGAMDVDTAVVIPHATSFETMPTGNALMLFETNVVEAARVHLAAPGREVTRIVHTVATAAGPPVQARAVLAPRA
mmetsp:Transcript_11466/g.17347  ORF Transcript_11466/g.17347 Transcript_11466/m.17347 type:complete len:222 (+) Transcript_11466:340-1005(+)